MNIECTTWKCVWLATVIASLACSVDARGDSEGPAGYGDHPLDQAKLEQRLGERVPLELAFTDEDGERVTLGDCVGEKPAILVLAYYRCPMLCGLVLNGLVEALHDVPLNAGEDFTVIVVSIDPRETPTAARKAKTTLLADYDRAGAERGWRLLTGEQANIEQLAAAVGFGYAYDERTDQYAHPSGIMIVAPDGTLSQYLYGFEFFPRELTGALETAKAGDVGKTVTEVLLSCFFYDPTTGKYGFTIMAALRFGGVMTIVGMLGFIAWAILREKRKQGEADGRAKPQAAGITDSKGGV